MTRAERDLRRLAAKHGWQLERRAKHLATHAPGGAIVIASKTSSDGNVLRILAGAIRRAERERPA